MPGEERITIFERAILDELGVESAVGAVVDVLEEDAVQRRRDRSAGRLDVDRDAGGFVGVGYVNGCGESGRLRCRRTNDDVESLSAKEKSWQSR